MDETDLTRMLAAESYFDSWSSYCDADSKAKWIEDYPAAAKLAMEIERYRMDAYMEQERNRKVV